MCESNKRSHNIVPIETKLDMIRRSESGESYSSIGRSLNINRTTAYSIIKNKDKIKEYVDKCGSVSTKIISKKHDVVMEKMEKSLKLWIEDNYQKGIPMNTSNIKAKALSLHEEWKKQIEEANGRSEENSTFTGSNGWFQKFKMRYSLLNIKFFGECTCADKNAADEFISNEPADATPLSMNNIEEALGHLDKFLSIMEECDPNGERISQIRRNIEKNVSCYRDIYEQMKKKI